MVVVRSSPEVCFVRKDALEAIEDPYTISVYVTLCSLAVDGEVELSTKVLSKHAKMSYAKFKQCKAILAKTIVNGYPLIKVTPVINDDGARGVDTIFLR